MITFLKDKFIYFQQHRFVRSTAILQVASFAGNIIQAIIGIFIARLLQPELYGVYAVVFSLAALIFITTGVQETITVVLGETYAQDDKARTLDALAFFLKFTIVFSVLTVIVTLFLPEIGQFFYHDYRIGLYAAIVVGAAIISSFAFSMISMMLQVAGKIKSMALLGLGDQALRSSLSLALIASGYGIVGAAVGHVIGAMIICVISVLLWRPTRRADPIFPSWRELLKRTKKIRRSPHLSLSVWVALDKNVSALYTILPVLMVGVYLARSEVTYFKLAFGFVMLALSLLGPISTLLNSEFSRMKVDEPKRLAQNFMRVTLYAVGISTILTIGAIVVAPFVFNTLYGPSFIPSVKYVYGLVVLGALFGFGVGLGPMWRVVNRVKTSVIINIVVLGIGIPAGLYFIKHLGGWGGILMVTVWFTASHLASFIYLVRKLKEN